MNSSSFFSEKRQYKTIASIPIDCEELQCLKSYFELEDLLFLQNLQNFDKENLENLSKQISFLIKNEKEYKHFLHYVIQSLLYFILIRPKQKEISQSLLLKLYFDFPNEKKFIIKTTMENLNFQQRYLIQDITFSPPDEKSWYYKQKISQYIISFEEREIEYILRNDNVNLLKEYINSHNDLSKYRNIYFLFENSYTKTKPPFYEEFQILRHELKFDEIKLLDYCCFYGSIDCFNFLKMNGFDYGDNIKEICISGGNIDIIHQVEQDEYSFDNCFRYSVMFHHKIISEWLLSNYKCEIFSITKCLKYLNFKTFAFFMFNNVPLNMKIPTPLSFLCKQDEFHIELIKLLINRGADVNIGDITPLGYLCLHENVNIELMNLLIDHGANVNKICYKKDESFTPLAYLCKQNKYNFKAIQFLIEKGADINQECKNNDGTIDTPLGYLCNKTEINFLLLKLFLKKGADLSTGTFTPLGHLCNQNKVNFKAMQLLINHKSSIVNEICYHKSSPIEEDQLVEYDYTPLALLCKQKEIDFQAFLYLIKKGADINQTFIDNMLTKTILGLLCEKENNDLEKLRSVINKVADINQYSENEKGHLTPLGILCEKKNINMDFLKLLIAKGADVNKECKYYTGPMTLLEILAEKDEIDIEAMKFLIDNGADVNKGNLKPLYLVINKENINIEAFKLLIANGANVKIEFKVSDNLYSPLSLLCNHKQVNYEAIKVLIEGGADVNKECIEYDKIAIPYGLIITKEEEFLMILNELEVHYNLKLSNLLKDFKEYENNRTLWDHYVKIKKLIMMQLCF